MIYQRVLVGFDGSPAAERALRLARELCTSDGELIALTVAETYQATHAGMDAVAWDGRIRAEAEAARLEAEAQLAGAPRMRAQVVNGYAAKTLLAHADAMNADVIAVGSHGNSRLAGILLGSVATHVIHEARCSVLVARGEALPAGPPARILVGVDASPSSTEAVAVAEALAASTGARVRHLTATGGKALPTDAALLAELDARPPVEALVDASRKSDLLVVGSRGAHGLAALGSVAERVAHEAQCPVLIVRGVVADAQQPGSARLITTS